MQSIPFAPFPIPVMLRMASPLRGLGFKISKAFPYLDMQLKQANMGISAIEYCSVMLFTSIFYLIIIALILPMLLRNFLFNSHNIVGIQVPEYLMLGVTISVIIATIIFFNTSMYPGVLVKKKIRKIERNLTYALRTMLMEIKSGVSLFDAMNMVAIGNYGELSKEFKKAVDEINIGAPQEDVLQKLTENNPSPHLRKAIWQIVNGMRAGGDINEVLGETVESLNREQKIEITRYGSSLRVLSLVYLMMGVIIPALGLTFLIVLGSFPKVKMEEINFWILLAVVTIGQFMLMGVIKSKRPNLMGS